MASRRAFAIAALATLAACSGQQSNTSLTTGGGTGIMYPISAEEADRVMATAMVGEFPGSAISAISLPNKGYIVTIGYLLDSHRISMVAIPATGLDTVGGRVPGFSFEVSHQGTMGITAPPRANSLFRRVNELAGAIKGPVRAA
jgi:hypothetical protein